MFQVSMLYFVQPTNLFYKERDKIMLLVSIHFYFPFLFAMPLKIETLNFCLTFILTICRRKERKGRETAERQTLEVPKVQIFLLE